MNTVATETMNIPFVDLKMQYDSIKPEIDAAIAAVINDTAFIGGPFVKQFEEAFAKYCGVPHCVGVANGTDAPQAHGALYKGVPISQLADITCFSFYPGKNLGAYGDGGALVTAREEWATTARMLANHGRTKKYDHDLEGVNSRLDGLQAAIL